MKLPKKWSSKKASTFSRCTPTQKRSRQRYQSILDNAVRIILEKGVDGFRMSDIIERANVPCGSLYQYFPDKSAIIGTLAEHLNAEGDACVKSELESVHGLEDVHPALCRITDGYYRALLEEPVMRDIWHAAQTDLSLQNLDNAHMELLSSYLLEVLQRLDPQYDPRVLAEISRLIMQLIAAAVRYAITLEKDAGDRAIARFKKMLPADPFALADRTLSITPSPGNGASG